MSTTPFPDNLVTDTTKPPVRSRAVEFAITEEIQSGSVFISLDATLPSDINLEMLQIGAWRLVKGTSVWELDRRIRAAGWHFSFFPQSIAAWSVGLKQDTVLWIALRQLLHRLDTTKFNAVAIDEFTHNRVFGVHIARVSAHPRSIRSGTLPDEAFRSVARSKPWRYAWDL